jgi:protein tyrosine/serine phosphatase
VPALFAAGVVAWPDLLSEGAVDGAAESWATPKTVERARTISTENDHIRDFIVVVKLLLDEHYPLLKL